MVKYTEQDIINGIKTGDRQIIFSLMKQHTPGINKIVNDFKIERYTQPEDVIQDGMVELIINIRENKFKGSCKVSTYYYSICRNICLKLYNRFKNIYHLSENFEIKDQDEDDFEKDERLDKVLAILKRMKTECIEIIDLRFGLTMGKFDFKEKEGKRGFEEIARILKIEYANARQRFGRCMQALLSEYQKNSEVLIYSEK